jgi:hypothetical protein
MFGGTSLVLTQVSNMPPDEGFFVKGELTDQSYEIEMFYNDSIVRHVVSAYDYDENDFVQIEQFLNPEGSKLSDIYSFPLEQLETEGENPQPLIIEVYRELSRYNPEEPDNPFIIPEYTYLYPLNKEPAETILGTVLILVDYTIYPELRNTLENDYARLLNSYGWNVVIHKAPRAEEFDAKEVQVTKSIVNSVYKSTDGELKSLLLLGRIPIPYSGGFTVDGHSPSHEGAWPADTYYADIDGLWPDTDENIAISDWERMFNFPGDGKFDLEFIPSDLELSVGRVDFYDLGYFDETEIDLYKRYLRKVIDYRSGKWDTNGDPDSLPDYDLNGIFQDDWNAYGTGFPGYSVRSYIGTMVGSENLDIGNIQNAPKNKVYDFAYGGASGGSESLFQVAYADEYAKNSYYNRFSQFFGSFVGDIDFPNQIMKSVIASEGQTLTCNFGGRPIWQIQEMANGATIGESYIRTANNRQRIFNGNGIGFSGGIHLMLLGDPTLQAGTVAGGTQIYDPATERYILAPAYDFEAYYVYSVNDELKRYDLETICDDLDCVNNNSIQDKVIRGLYLVENNFGSHYRLSAPVFVNSLTSVKSSLDNTGLSIQGNSLICKTRFTSSDITLSIIDVNGRVISYQQLTETELYNGFDLDKLNLHSGGYFAVVKGNNVNLHTKFSIIK